MDQDIDNPDDMLNSGRPDIASLPLDNSSESEKENAMGNLDGSGFSWRVGAMSGAVSSSWPLGIARTPTSAHSLDGDGVARIDGVVHRFRPLSRRAANAATQRGR